MKNLFSLFICLGLLLFSIPVLCQESLLEYDYFEQECIIDDIQSTIPSNLLFDIENLESEFEQTYLSKMDVSLNLTSPTPLISVFDMFILNLLDIQSKGTYFSSDYMYFGYMFEAIPNSLVIKPPTQLPKNGFNNECVNNSSDLELALSGCSDLVMDKALLRSLAIVPPEIPKNGYFDNLSENNSTDLALTPGAAIHFSRLILH